MSKKEMQDLDNEILEVANRAGEDRRSEDAQRAKEEERAQARRLAEEAHRDKQRDMAEQKRKALIAMLLRVLVCLLGVVVFVSLLLVPEAVPVVGCAGILIFACTCAVVVDRHVRRGR